MITLHNADARIFDALIDGCRIVDLPPVCPGGLEESSTLPIVARMAAKVRAEFSGASAWVIVADNEAVGLISYTSAPALGVADIGYGIGASRRGRGYASAAVAAVAKHACREGLHTLTAETAHDNPASQRVLEHNGFARCADSHDPENGRVIGWSLDLQGMA